MSKKIEYDETPQFQKDLKKLLKRFPTLRDDLEVAKSAAIELYHVQNVNNQSVFPIPNFCSENILVCKIKKFACRSLKGRGAKSGIRVVYAFFLKDKKVDFLEMYFKGNKENEDRDRINEYLKTVNKPTNNSL